MVVKHDTSSASFNTKPRDEDQVNGRYEQNLKTANDVPFRAASCAPRLNSFSEIRAGATLNNNTVRYSFFFHEKETGQGLQTIFK